MSRCWSDGELRAWLDRELGEPDGADFELHLAKCADCAARRQVLEDRSKRIGVLMSSLTEAVPAARVTAIPARRPSWRWTGVPAAIAAGVTLAFLLTPRAQHPVVPTPRAPTAPEVPAVKPAIAPPPVARARPRVVPPAKARPQTNGDYYLALDDDPIDTGVVMRVALDGNLQADVIFDSQGRPRAIRPVKESAQGERR